MIRSLGKDRDVFYFYPHEVRGFIESCVLASQRIMADSRRKDSIYEDLQLARQEWTNQEEREALIKNWSYNGLLGVEDYEVDYAFKHACRIDNATLDNIELLRDVYGEYGIDARSFYWTNGNALRMKVSY